MAGKSASVGKCLNPGRARPVECHSKAWINVAGQAQPRGCSDLDDEQRDRTASLCRKGCEFVQMLFAAGSDGIRKFGDTRSASGERS